MGESAGMNNCSHTKRWLLVLRFDQLLAPRGNRVLWGATLLTQHPSWLCIASFSPERQRGGFHGQLYAARKFVYAWPHLSSGDFVCAGSGVGNLWAAGPGPAIQHRLCLQW